MQKEVRNKKFARVHKKIREYIREIKRKKVLAEESVNAFFLSVNAIQ